MGLDNSLLPTKKIKVSRFECVDIYWVCDRDRGVVCVHSIDGNRDGCKCVCVSVCVCMCVWERERERMREKERERRGREGDGTRVTARERKRKQTRGQSTCPCESLRFTYKQVIHHWFKKRRESCRST